MDETDDVRAYVVPDGDSYVPTRIAQGPWGATMAGHVIGGILGWAAERAAGDPELQPARLTVDLFRPTKLEPMRVTATIARDGRRIRVVDATLTQHGTDVARASAVFVRRGSQPDQHVWSMPVTMPPMPSERDAAPDNSPFFLRAYGWGSDTGPAHGVTHRLTPKYAWVRETKVLVDGEPLTPFTRAAMAGDVTNPLTHWGTKGLQFINVDYTLTLSRLPSGPDIGLAALTHYSHAGVAAGAAMLFDQHGPIGNGMATALADTRFRPPRR
ncbi:thioesterase family protein [Mycobacterium botniense]|uniref:thioesterase family protein n=1 Tax=Mycobacterium botniense TaxID=84962 RepID=UPI001FE2B529